MPKFNSASGINGGANEDAEFFKHIHLEINTASRTRAILGLMSDATLEQLARDYKIRTCL